MIPEVIVAAGAAEESGGDWNRLLTSTRLTSTRSKTSAESHIFHGRIRLNARFGS
jgi:hypothetical protein